jgi:DNA-binding NtrC family response regulator
MPNIASVPDPTSAPRAPQDAHQAATPRVLVVDDERSMRELLAIVLKREGYDVLLAENGRMAVAALERGSIDLLVSDIRMPDMTGIEVLRAAKAVDPGIEAIMVTAFASQETAIEAMRLGACDYLIKPFDVDELKVKVRDKLESRRLRRENVLLKRALGTSHQFHNIIGRSDAMLEVFGLVETIARTTSTVLITGESGTGKELVARAVHFHSLRRDRPFVAVNCGALTETLLESELFGHVRGAFTGAATSKKGKFALADGGTIFLDEIGTMSTALQAKLLRVLQEREFEPLGSERTQKIDVRVIAATNRDLRQMVSEARFQEDLYYRLNVIPIHIAPLRERREDIPILVEHFIAKHAQRAGKRITGIEPAVMETLKSADWPGNVRELENTVERAVVLSPTPIIGPDVVRLLGATTTAASGLPSLNLRQNLDWTERETVRRALESGGGVKKDAAEAMGISQRALSYYLAKHRID